MWLDQIIIWKSNLKNERRKDVVTRAHYLKFIQYIPKDINRNQQIQLIELDETVKVAYNQQIYQFYVNSGFSVKQLKQFLHLKLKNKNKNKKFNILLKINKEQLKKQVLIKDIPQIFKQTLQMELEQFTASSFKGITVKLKQSDSSYVRTSYESIRGKTVRQVLRMLMKNSQYHYCLAFGSCFLFPSDKIDKILQDKKFSYYQDLMILVIKSSQKILFYKYIKQKIPFTQQQLVVDQQTKKQFRILIKDTQLKTKNSELATQEFITPLLLYTSNHNYRQINANLRKIQMSDLRVFETTEMTLISSIVKSLKMLPNYIGVVYRGMENFRMSKFQKVGDIFYWKQFTSTSQDIKTANKFKKDNGSIFRITSLTGKDISLYSVYQKEKQVLFLPFTYFLIEKIQSKEQYDEVWLSEIPTPLHLEKNFVVWVDDNPQNNLNAISEVIEPNVEVLQLTSTLMATKWAQQFIWLLNWMGIKHRIISNMVRKENGKDNYESGIDLLERLHKFQGYSTPILIFCGDVQKAKQNVKNRKIAEKGILQITKSAQVLKQYLKFD